MIDQIYYWDNFLTESEYPAVEQEFDKHKWTFSAGENKEQYPEVRTFWHKELIDSKLIESIFREKTEQLLKVKVETDRLYGNGQATGQSAFIHVDVPEDNEGEWGSIVYYLHRAWKPQYGGHLIFVDPKWETVTNSFFPKSNSAILFNSKMNHCALEPTVYCQDMRISIAYKFKVIK
jgi:hypothetical protein